MNLQEFKNQIAAGNINLPWIKEGIKVKGQVIKKSEVGLLVDCEDGAFTGVILPKELKDLERKGEDLNPGKVIEAEILNPELMDDEGLYIISISKLLQYDYWKDIVSKVSQDEVITVVPTEANLGGLLVDILGIKGFIPLSQLAPINYPRVEDGDQEKIFEKIISLIGKEFKVRVINIDEENKRMILSEREALREERDNIMKDLAVGSEYDGVISGVSSYGLFVTIGGGIEGLVHISEITYGHVDNIDRFAKPGNKIRVKVIGIDDGKISLSVKQLKPDPWTVIPQNYTLGDVLEGPVVRFVPYGVFIRVYDDINGLIHLSEITSRTLTNPAEILKIGQVVKAKIILLEPEKRKIGLSIKAFDPNFGEEELKNKRTYKPRTPRQDGDERKPAPRARTPRPSQPTQEPKAE